MHRRELDLDPGPIRAALRPCPEIVDACVFGSLARGGADARSDVGAAVLNSAPPLLYHRVLRDGERLLSRDLLATTRREGQALSRFCDWVPQLARIEAAHRRRMAAGELGK